MRMPVSRYWLGLSVFIATLDQVSKYWITHLIIPGQVLPLFSWLNIYLVYNPGAAFSFLAQANGWQRVFLVTLSIACSLVMLWLLWSRTHHTRMKAALSLGLGGAMGNLYDRVCYGAVIDFIDFHIGDWHFATFNLADSALCLGAIFWFLAPMASKNFSRP